MFSNLLGDLRGENLHRCAEFADEARVFGIGRIGVHMAVGLEALEMCTDVIERGVGKRPRLRVVVAPEPPAGVEDAGGGS